MIILKPSSQNSHIYIRCRQHNESSYLCTVYLNKDTIYIINPLLTYVGGFLEGDIALPFTTSQESGFCKARIFSVKDSTPILTTIDEAPEDYLVYNYAQYIELISDLMLAHDVEEEVYRGTCLISSATDFEKYRLTSDFITP